MLHFAELTSFWFCTISNVMVLFSDHRKQGAEIFFCASHGCQGRVRSSKRIPAWHLLQGALLHFVKVRFFGLCIIATEKRSVFSSQKAGSSTFVLCLTWLPGQGEKQQENSLLEPSPGEQHCTFPSHVFWFCMGVNVLCQFFTTESREQNFYDVRHMSARAG